MKLNWPRPQNPNFGTITTPSSSAFVPLAQKEADAGEVQKWLTLAVGGDKTAFEELYHLYAEAIFRYCSYRVGSIEDAEDLTIQVFWRAWQAIGRFQIGQAPFLAWLYRIAHNLVVNHYRTRLRYQPEIADACLDEVVVNNLEDTAPPLESLFEEGQHSALNRALAQLTQEQQQVIYFRFVEEWSHAQIAAHLGKKEGAVRGLQCRAIATLEKILQREQALA